MGLLARYHIRAITLIFQIMILLPRIPRLIVTNRQLGPNLRYEFEVKQNHPGSSTENR